MGMTEIIDTVMKLGVAGGVIVGVVIALKYGKQKDDSTKQVTDAAAEGSRLFCGFLVYDFLDDLP